MYITHYKTDTQNSISVLFFQRSFKGGHNIIHFIEGDILQSTATAIVNPVNCEGYMGKGLAYQIKLEYPATFKDYAIACKDGRLKIGNVHYFEENGKIIINFPTKNKWRAKSKLSYIIDALPNLINLIKEKKIKSIAIPPLGCGLGGLDWEDVKQVLLSSLESISDQIDVYIYRPV